jgi:hypothetical protein
MGKIYKLECHDGHYYYGSTRGELNTRLEFHKKDSKTKSSYVYQHINMIGWNNVRIVLVEEIGEGIRKKEDEYIRAGLNDHMCLNSNIVIATGDDMKRWQKTYREKHKEREKERVAKWQKENREKVAATQRRYVEKDPIAHKGKQKAWYQKNKASVLEKQKIYKEANREKVTAYAKAYYQKKIKENSQISTE